MRITRYLPGFPDGVFCHYARDVPLVILLVFSLACCTSINPVGSELAQLHLFGDGSSPRFRFYLSCSGEVSAETDMCWVAEKYFSLWASERHVTIRQLSGVATDAEQTTAIEDRAKADSAVDYRIVVHFMPVAVPSAYDLVDSRGGYTPPKAGYKADLYVYAQVSGKLVMQTHYHRKSEAGYRGDAVPYVKDGVRDVLAALDPGYVQASANK